MKKLNRYLDRSFLPVKLFIDDLELIEETLKTFSDNFIIETDEYSFESVKELQNNLKQQSLRRLSISTENPSVSISFRESFASLRVRSLPDNLNSDGLFSRLEEIICKREKGHKWIYSIVSYWIACLISVLISLSLPGKTFPVIFLWGLIAICTLLYFTLLYINVKRHSIIWLTYSHDQKPFWKRNKDQLILATVSALLGCLSGIIGTLIVTYLTKK